MIRSGEHELWDAYMATGRARAEMAAALPPFARAMRRLARAVGASFEPLARQMQALAAAYGRSMPTAADAGAAHRRVAAAHRRAFQTSPAGGPRRASLPSGAGDEANSPGTDAPRRVEHPAPTKENQ